MNKLGYWGLTLGLGIFQPPVQRDVLQFGKIRLSAAVVVALGSQIIPITKDDY